MFIPKKIYHKLLGSMDEIELNLYDYRGFQPKKWFVYIYANQCMLFVSTSMVLLFKNQITLHNDFNDGARAGLL